MIFHDRFMMFHPGKMDRLVDHMKSNEFEWRIDLGLPVGENVQHVS